MEPRVRHLGVDVGLQALAGCPELLVSKGTASHRPALAWSWQRELGICGPTGLVSSPSSALTGRDALGSCSISPPPPSP